jgi:hypothetical protein
MTPSWKEGHLEVIEKMVDLVGIEPTTSSMPWKRAPKLRHRPTRLVVSILYEPAGIVNGCKHVRGV